MSRFKRCSECFLDHPHENQYCAWCGSDDFDSIWTPVYANGNPLIDQFIWASGRTDPADFEFLENYRKYIKALELL